MTTRFYFERKVKAKRGNIRGFRWRIQRTESSIQKPRGRYWMREVKYLILRRNKLNTPTYTDHLTVKIRVEHLDEYHTKKKRLDDVWRLVVYKSGKIVGESVHKVRRIALNRYYRTITSLDRHLKNKDFVKGWKPPKR
jgi:hypothetical protein